MKNYNHITTIEIDEELTVVSIDFESDGREVEIQRITDLDNGNAIAPDLNGQMSDFQIKNIYDDLAEFAADMEAEKVSNGRFNRNDY